MHVYMVAPWYEDGNQTELEWLSYHRSFGKAWQIGIEGHESVRCQTCLLQKLPCFLQILDCSSPRLPAQQRLCTRVWTQEKRYLHTVFEELCSIKTKTDCNQHYLTPGRVIFPPQQLRVQIMLTKPSTLMTSRLSSKKGELRRPEDLGCFLVRGPWR